MQQHGSRRCTECRCRYEPAASAVGTQKVCGEPCRKKRRRRLARGRRAQAVQDARVDERERQRACRKRRHAAGCGPPAGGAGASAGCGPGTAAGPSAGSCHAPPSADIPAELQEEMLELWDRAVAMSRASLKRRMEAITRGLDAICGRGSGVTDGLSRASLGP
jgi:hypothetical protein